MATADESSKQLKDIMNIIEEMITIIKNPEKPFNWYAYIGTLRKTVNYKVDLINTEYMHDLFKFMDDKYTYMCNKLFGCDKIAQADIIMKLDYLSCDESNAYQALRYVSTYEDSERIKSELRNLLENISEYELLLFIDQVHDKIGDILRK